MQQRTRLHSRRGRQALGASRLLGSVCCAWLLLLACHLIHCDGVDASRNVPSVTVRSSPRSSAYADGVDSLVSQLRGLGAFVHPDLRVAPSEHTGGAHQHAPLESLSSMGVRSAADLPVRTLLLSIPTSLSLTGDRAFESLSPLLTPAQLDAILDVQSDTCEFIDWMTVIYVAVAAAHINHPAAATAAAADQPPPSPSSWLSELHPTCPAPFFPIDDDASSFPPRLHSLWSRMVSLYPVECAGAICLPKSVRVSELLNTPLLLRRNHQHIACVERARNDAERVLAALHQCPSRLPYVDRTLLLWAASMLLSRQQSVLTSLPSSQSGDSAPDPDVPSTRVPALLPLFDLFNTHTTALNHSHPLVYRTHDAAVATGGDDHSSSRSRSRSRRSSVPATQAYTQGTIPAGSEIFDLYGGAHPSPNIDLLTFYGFGAPELPNDSLAIALAVCIDVDTDAQAPHDQLLQLRRLQSEALQRMAHAFAAAPLALDQHLDPAEIDAMRFVQSDGTLTATADGDGGTAAGNPSASVPSSCRHRRVMQGTLTSSGVSVTLLTLSRLAVASLAQLRDDEMMQKLVTGVARLPLRQERAALLLLLEWLHTSHRAAQTEWWGPLRCTHPSLPWPQPPTPLTSAQRALVQLPVRVLWRQADGAATEWLHTQAEVEAKAEATRSAIRSAAPSPTSSGALFDVHAQLCRVKSSHIRLLFGVIRALTDAL